MKIIKTRQAGFGGVLLVAASFIFALGSCNQGTKEQSQDTPGADKTTTESATPVSMTVQGEILDLSCYMKDGSMGMGHQSCAQGCLDKGLPAGILSKADGKVYLLIEDHKKSDVYKTALQHAAQNVEITGTVINKNGVQSLVVEDVKSQG